MFPDTTVVAIGGITLEAIGAVKSTGVDCIAVISALFAADEIESMARAMVEAWEGA
jgi:thiamine monophosphate synthase